MNNLRLLTGLLAAALVSGRACVSAQEKTLVSLEELFEIAESNSTRLRPSLAAIDEAQKATAEERTHRLPDINATLTLSYNGDGFTTRRNFSDYQKAPVPHFGNALSLTVSQPVYTGGAITAGIEMADLKLTAARYASELQRDNIRFQLTGFYLDIYKYTNLRQVVEKNIMLTQRVVADMESRHEQGVALRNDITRYELLLSSFELQRVKIDNMLDILNNNLVTIAGLPEGTRVMPDTTILLRSLPAMEEAKWQAEAMENSPSLRLAKTSLDISRKGEQLARAERMPKVGLQAGWSLEGPILVEVPPINRNLSYWYVGVGVNYSLSSLFKTNKTLARSRAAVTTAADNLAAAVEDTGMAVRADYIRYFEAYEELKTMEKSVELADRNYSTIFTRYTADMALVTDMIDAANSRLEAEQQLVNARINIIYYYYKLLFTTGKI
ncbi:MAG: TolC family protein [Pseudoflavonifractor sp.]|nr:TolC family protein [Alloprevotella sp.]MCM1116477.1 TolC family protein [Pseudoflavonifractor sp.]